tara:strand:+ start:361 stop:468 length:108 start_codon:yes stop_codon:yes gene_type:complete
MSPSKRVYVDGVGWCYEITAVLEDKVEPKEDEHKK